MYINVWLFESCSNTGTCFGMIINRA